MKEMYNNYKNELRNKNTLTIIVLVIFIIGIIFGSIYITIISNDQKTTVLNQVNSYFSSLPKTNFEDKIDLFKNSLYSNMLYTFTMWVLGISIIGIPIVIIMLFFKSFIYGFSISSIFAKYGIKGLFKVILYLFPTNIVTIIYILFLSIYSILISIKLFKAVFKKQSLNFKTFIGKYFFILVIGILINILCSLYDGFAAPFIYQIFK